MAEVLRCDHCASRDLTRVSDVEYTCNHCKSRILLSEKPVPPAPRPVPRPTAVPTRPQTLLQKLGTVALILLGLGVVVGLRMHRAEERADRARRESIRRSVAASLPGTFRAPRNPSAQPSGDGDSAQPPQNFGAGSIEAEKSLSATFTELTPLPDSIGNIYFVGLYKNIGEATIERPQVEITLLGAQGKKLNVAHGYGAPSVLFPGEETPVKILVQQAPAYETAKYTITPERTRYGGHKHFKLSVEGARLSAAQFGGYDLSGTVRNKDSEAAQHVQLIILLRDDKKVITAMDSGFLGQRVLPAGEESPFRVHLSQVHGKPSSFTVYSSALAVRN